jgi:hypothetical protein
MDQGSGCRCNLKVEGQADFLKALTLAVLDRYQYPITLSKFNGG